MAEVVRKGPARTVRLAARGADGPEDGGEQAEHPGAAQQVERGADGLEDGGEQVEHPGAAQTSGGGHDGGAEQAEPQGRTRQV